MRSTPVELVPVSDTVTREAAQVLITEYLRWIAATAHVHYGLSFDIDAMIASDLNDPHKFYPPTGRFYVVRHASAYIGVGCLKQLAPTIAEIQRMYIQPHVRGLGAGRRLVEQLVADARTIGYHRIRLESLNVLAAAHALYRSVGFVEVDPYTDNSMQHFQASDTLQVYHSGAVFMELRLDPTGGSDAATI